MDSEIAKIFLDYSSKTLRQMCGHIEGCLARLSDDQIWSRGAPHENSIGNLILHLCGNVRQWIGSGVGGESDIRDRDSEFSRRGGLSGPDLLRHLNQTVSHAIEIISRTNEEQLVRETNPQGYRVSGLEAIYHVVGHFEQHTGQIIFATKIYAGEDLGLYRPKTATK